MFTENNQIIKIDGKEVFVDIRSCFEIDKVVMQFRKYDNAKEKGSKITKQVDFFLSLEDFSYLCYALYSGGINTILKTSGYTNYGGSVKEGLVTSRVLKIEGGTGDKYYLKVQSGPGKRTTTGAITPAFADGKPETEIVMKLSLEQLKKIGLSGERAIRIRDMWVAMGCLKEKCESLRFGKPANDQSRIYSPAAPDIAAPELF